MESDSTPTIEKMPHELRLLGKQMQEVLNNLQSISQRLRDAEKKDVWLSVKEVASYVGLAESTIRMKVSRDEIPSRKIGGRRMFNRNELAKWMDEEKCHE